MGWVTLDDGQHVFISAGGKVLASRSKISSAGGAKERGKSLAARSKAAIGNALAKQRTAIATGIGEWNKPGAETERSRLKREISQHLANRERIQAAKKSKRLTELERKESHNEEQAKGLAKDIIASHGKDALKELGRRLDRSAQYDRSVQGKDWQPSQQTNNLVAAKEHVQKHFESATTRAIEHAKAASTKPIGMTYHDVHPAKAIQAGVPDAVRSVNFHDPSGRTYINVHTNDSFRGDRSLKLFVDIKGTLVHEYGRGTVSPPAKADRDAILAHAKKIGVRVEDRPTHR